MYCPKGNLDSGIWEIFVCGIRNTGKFGMWHPESWVLESRIQHKESRIPLTIIGFTDKTDKDWNPVPRIRNPLCGIQNPRLP